MQENTRNLGRIACQVLESHVTALHKAHLWPKVYQARQAGPGFWLALSSLLCGFPSSVRLRQAGCKEKTILHCQGVPVYCHENITFLGRIAAEISLPGAKSLSGPSLPAMAPQKKMLRLQALLQTTSHATVMKKLKDMVPKPRTQLIQVLPWEHQSCISLLQIS